MTFTAGQRLTAAMLEALRVEALTSGIESVTFATATSHIRTVTFGVTLPFTPAYVDAIVSSGSGTTTGWVIRTDSYSTTGFRLLLSGPSAAWSSVDVRWHAVAPL